MYATDYYCPCRRFQKKKKKVITCRVPVSNECVCSTAAARALLSTEMPLSTAACVFKNRRADLEGKDKYSKFKAVDNHSNWVIPISPPLLLSLSQAPPLLAWCQK